MAPNNTADRIIYASIAALLTLGLVSFFRQPSYEKGVWVVIGAFSSALSGALGFKFGITQAQKGTDREDKPSGD